jgi:hypothetical protein
MTMMARGQPHDELEHDIMTAVEWHCMHAQ